MSALCGAAGRLHDPELTGLLLEAGANSYDGESLYHATEAEDPACLELLLEHRASTRGTNALAHALDDERLPHVRALLAAGADPNEGALLAHAVRRGRGPEFLRLLAAHGAELDRPGGETWRGDVPLRTPYQHARLRGRADSAEALAELGASTEVAPEDLAVAAVVGGERPAVPLPAELDPDAQEVLILAAREAGSTQSSTPSGSISAAWSAAPPKARCFTTQPGSATPLSSAHCSTAGPTRSRARRSRRSPGRSTALSSGSRRTATTSAWRSS
jgi:hypothetical protein